MRTKILYLIFAFAAATAINSSAQNVIPFYKNGVSGYKDAATGQVVIPAKYRSASTMIPYGKSSDFYAVVSFEGKFGYINQRGETLIPFIYDVANIFTEGVAPVKLNGKYGFINMKNETVIPFQYDYAGKVNSGMARIEKSGMWGFINVNTKVEIPLQFYNANDFSEGLASVMNSSAQWGFIDVNGNYAIAPQFTKAESFKNGQAMVHNGNNFVYINTSGQVLRNLER
jgi:hypothetical protein